MTFRVLLVAAATLLLASLPALADGEGPGPKRVKPLHPTPASLFRKDKTCKSASDGCRICSRTETGFACSTPGIACIAVDWTCKERIQSP